MVRASFVCSLVVSALVAVGCGAGPTNGGGAPNLNNTNRSGLPGGEINTRGGFSNNINGGGGPSFDKTNTSGLPGGPINGRGGPSEWKAKPSPSPSPSSPSAPPSLSSPPAPPSPSVPPSAADSGSIDL